MLLHGKKCSDNQSPVSFFALSSVARLVTAILNLSLKQKQLKPLGKVFTYKQLSLQPCREPHLSTQMALTKIEQMQLYLRKAEQNHCGLQGIRVVWWR